MKKLQVPYNLDLNMIDLYIDYNMSIAEIYFAAPPSIFPTARQFAVNENEYLDDCCFLCRTLKNYAIDTMLLLNGTNVELNRQKFGEIYSLISTLKTCKLTGVVVANPILAEWVHRTFPELKIRLSVLSNIYSISKIKQIESLGYIQEICLPQDLNRNEDELKRIKENTSLKISTIVNSACRINCPLYYWHHNAFNSNFIWKNCDSVILKDNFFSQTQQFNQNKFCAPWLLPEELVYYDRYFDGFKLEDRTCSSDILQSYIEYYSWRINPSNFSKIIHGSCLSEPFEEFDPHDIPQQWLLSRRNCKGECWKCSSCNNILESLKKKQEEKLC